MKQRLNIKCMEHLASRLGCNEALLDALKNGMKQACKVKIINKKGKLRKVVDAVDPRLKEIQTRILGLLNNLSLSSNAHGWIKKRSIKTNAIPHCGNPAKLCLDLKDCYPNVPSMRIRRLFEEELGCSPQVSSVLTRLTTYDFCLSQGFSTSGALLNLVFRPIDALLKSYANQYSLQYSRYGDDLTFSGIFIPEFFKRNIKFFAISLDDLLSREEIFTVAQEDSKQRIHHFRDLVFGLLDCSVATYFFLPIFAQNTGDVIESVSLLSYTKAESYIIVPYMIIVIGLILCGVITLALQNCTTLFWIRIKSKLSLSLSVLATLFFMLSRQPYAGTFILVFMIIKTLMLIKWT